jgi:hypothetical protein
MKIFSKKNFFVIFSVFSGITVFAADPPEPLPTDNGPGPPPPVGLPIDQGLFVLLLIALLYGIYVIYRFRSKVKASV